MRIAVLCADLGIRVPGDKGASLHLQSISNAFARAGHDVMLIAVAGHEPCRLDIETRLFTHPGRRDGLAREVQKIAFNETVTAAAVPVLREFRPDFLYERLALFADCGQRLATKLRIPHVVEVNALLAREESQWRGLRLGGLAGERERSVLQHCNLVVAVSDEVSHAVRRLVPDTDADIAVVPNGVETELFATVPDRASARRRFGLAPNGRVIGFAGALRPWHGLDIAIRGLTALPDDVVLAVAGDGPIRADLDALARDVGVASRVRWLGSLPHAEIPEFLAAVDVALAPYPDLDDFAFSPLKLYEYLASGTPVVASDIGQVRTAMHADGGLLAAAGDAAALAAAVRRILGDLDLWRRRAANARRHALASHGWESRAADIVARVEGTSRRAVA